VLGAGETIEVGRRTPGSICEVTISVLQRRVLPPTRRTSLRRSRRTTRARSRRRAPDPARHRETADSRRIAHPARSNAHHALQRRRRLKQPGTPRRALTSAERRIADVEILSFSDCSNVDQTGQIVEAALAGRCQIAGPIYQGEASEAPAVAVPITFGRSR
jgi:hypothetical protein